MFKFIAKAKKKPIITRSSVISSVKAQSTLIGRKKVETLKKIGKKKRG